MSRMTEHQTMNTIIHAAFRRDLKRFDDTLSRFPDGSSDRANQLRTAWRNFSHQLHHHHNDEETIFWPALRELGADPALVADLDGEHQRMLLALQAVDDAMPNLPANPSAENAADIRAKILALNSVLVDHLAHEERDLEPLAATHKSSPQMKAAAVSVRQAYKGSAGNFAAWLLDGADAGTTASLRREIPAPVVFMLSRFGGRSYHRDVATVWR